MSGTDDDRSGPDPTGAEATRELRPPANADEVTRRLPVEPGGTKPVTPGPVARGPVAPVRPAAGQGSTETATEPVVEPAGEPAGETAAEPTVELAAERTVELAAEPPAPPAAKPAAPPAAKPAAAPAADPASEPAAEAAADEPADVPEPGGEYEPDSAARPAGRARRISAAGAIIGLLLGLLGFALVVQLRSNGSDPELATARPEDLVRILSDLDARQERLRQEISQLEDSQRQLVSGAQGREAALQEARRRADELGILAGTLPAQGPGLEIKFAPGGDGIPSSTVLDAVEELRGAGGEAMQITGQNSPAVRIVASTYFSDARDGLVVDGAHLAAPYTLVVIGDPQTMHTALNIPGGVVDTVRQRGGNVIVQESEAVRVTALHQVGAPKFAHPVS